MKFLPMMVKSKLRLVRFIKNKLNAAKKSHRVATFIAKSMISSKGNVLYSVLIPLSSVPIPLYSVLIPLYSVLPSLYSALFSLCSVLSSLYSVQTFVGVNFIAFAERSS